MVAGSRCSGRASTKAIITAVSTASDCFSSSGSVIASRGIIAMTRAFALPAWRVSSAPQSRWIIDRLHQP